MKQVIAKAQDLSAPLLMGVLGALIWANLDHDGYEAVIHMEPFGIHALSPQFLVNDLFMVFFFGIAAKEITEAVLPGGALDPPRNAINPLLGTIGGVAGPVLVYLAYVHFVGRDDLIGGWGIPTATDIALAWLVARIAFGPQHPAVSFLLLLAVADDAIGLVIIGVFYPDPNHPIEPVWLVLVGVALVLAYALRKKKVQSFWAYLLIPGALSWAGLFLAHVHPALALVPIVPFMPAADHDEGLFAELGDDGHLKDTLNKFEHFFKGPVDFGLFAFGLANAGVVFNAVGDASWAVLVALLVGKTLGIFCFSMGGHLAGFSLPEGMDARSLLLSGAIAGLGLTVALFVAGVAFTDPALVGSAKMGALFSAVIGPVVILIAWATRPAGAPAPEPVLSMPPARRSLRPAPTSLAPPPHKERPSIPTGIPSVPPPPPMGV